MLPTANPAAAQHSSLHPAFYIIIWITLSSGVIVFNKWILHTAGFAYPLFLTTWHLIFATVMTQLMARYTKMLDSRHNVPMTRAVYFQAIVPIGVFFSLSLICGNLAYLHLSVSFVQMLKATNSVATLLATWVLGVAPVRIDVLAKVSIIVIGVIVASIGEINFSLIGFIYQFSATIFESVRLVMVQRLLSSADFKMDPLVSLYYFAPACMVMNTVATLFFEVPRMSVEDLRSIGLSTLLANASVAFALNVAVVFLVSKTSALVMTLSGVLKDIILVIASLVIFHDPVTMTQVVGYTVALLGLLYYKLGDKVFADVAIKVRQHIPKSSTRRWTLPATLLVIVLIFLLWYSGTASTYFEELNVGH
ncbi:triose-phosphate transporter family-domain-containing protein [Talaromyces proteolyticus]|uniref:Triose-phosphate transporter family-domain-containing protein n=1 Tax=Talaromyces proteolyticus TaxID=1131652 RepID=A0AAD4KDQ5_9EURO|nr:triose-phosphate transporter family-domain-containing protein [Talaromyces proteolyticus]KAH8689377.1 triose-phosphate transporter family-domain-containing protein [Talaromyces proteolyticus]